MILFIVFSSLLLAGSIPGILCNLDQAFAPINRAFYIPRDNLKGDILTGGSPILKNKSIRYNCRRTKHVHIINQAQTFFEDTETFYSAQAASVSLSPDLATDFTLGHTLDVTTNHVSSSNRTIRGVTLKIVSKSFKHYLESRCISMKPLRNYVVHAFEILLTTIDKPWLYSSWQAYKVFLDIVKSHLVTQATYGTSLYQHCFSDSSNNYTQRQYVVKACVELAGSTEMSELGIGACLDITDEEIKSVQSLRTHSRLVIRGGTERTRAALQRSRNKKLIQRFLQEADTNYSAVQYKFMPMWDVLKVQYFGTKHFAKALNFEAFYKGFLNFGCNYRVTSAGVELQTFNLTQDSTESNPSYQCIIAPEGCNDNNDCQSRKTVCEYNGDSCIRYEEENLNSGVTREFPYIYEEHGWNGHGCTRDGLSCDCRNKDKNWVKIWPPFSSQFNSFMEDDEDEMNAVDPGRDREIGL